MEHSYPLITTVAASLGLALILGLIAVRLKLPALVGYLLAGVLLGPATPGFVADMNLSAQLAEIGVILLMFGVGLHFSFKDLWKVRRIALPGAVLQIAVATALGAWVSSAWGWDIGAGIVFGLALSVASTVVLLKALEQRGLLTSVNGQIAIGWLVVEDLVIVIVLVLLPSLPGWLGPANAPLPQVDQALLTSLLLTIGKVALFIMLMLVVGRRIFPWLIWRVGETGSRELFILSVIAAAIGIAFGSAYLFGVSFALGAFFAGMVMRESPLSHRAANESLPFRDAFSVLFFVSVGMLFDPAVLIEQPLRVVAVVAIILLGKSVAAFVLVLMFRYPLNTALTVSASLAQIGEFSFILGGLGVALGLMPGDGQTLIVAGALISIALNPVLFGLISPLQTWIRSRSEMARFLERANDPLAELPMTVSSRYLTGHVVLVGYGRAGRRIGAELVVHNVPLVVAEQNRELVEQLRASGLHAVAGDASEPSVIIQAHIARAAILVISISDVTRVQTIIELARMLNPGVEVLVRSHSEDEMALLQAKQSGEVFLDEQELAASMVRRVLEKIRG